MRTESASKSKFSMVFNSSKQMICECLKKIEGKDIVEALWNKVINNSSGKFEK